MNFLTLPDIVNMSIGSRMFRHSSPYEGRAYTLESIHRHRHEIVVSFVRPDGKKVMSSWQAPDVIRKCLMTTFDPSLAMHIKIPRTTQAPMPPHIANQQNSVHWKDLVLGMVITQPGLPVSYVVNKIDKHRHGFEVTLKSVGPGHYRDELELDERTFNRGVWVEDIYSQAARNGSFAGHISAQVKQATTRMMDSASRESYNAQLKFYDGAGSEIIPEAPKCNHTWRKENFGFFSNVWHETCTVCGAKKEDV